MSAGSDARAEDKLRASDKLCANDKLRAGVTVGAGGKLRADGSARADVDLHSGDAPARGLSAMLWFRADPTRDDEVLAALRQVAGSIASLASSRIGHRPEEDRPYRTWMIDAGPVDASRLDSLMWRLQKAFNAAGLPALSRGEPQFERFVWIDDDVAGSPTPPCV